MLYDEEHFLGLSKKQDEKLKYDEEHFLGNVDGYMLTEPPEAPESDSFLQRILGRFAPSGAEPEGEPVPQVPQTAPMGEEFPSMDWLRPGKVGGKELLEDFTAATKAVGGELWNMAIAPATGVVGVMGLPFGLNESVKQMEKFQQIAGYNPKPGTKEREAQEIITYPFRKLHEFALEQGDVELKRFGSPLYAAAVATAYDLLPMMFLHGEPEVTSRAIVRFAKEMETLEGADLKGNTGLTRGDLARKYKHIFEEELRKTREASPVTSEESAPQEPATDPTLIKSTEGTTTPTETTTPAKPPALEAPVPPSLVETVREMRQEMADHLADRINQDPVLTAKREKQQEEIRQQAVSGELRARPSGPVIPLEGPTADAMIPLKTPLPDFQSTDEVEAWAKTQKPTAELVAETFRLSDAYNEQAKQLRDKKLWDESVKAETKAQMYREAREELLGTGEAREDPVVQFDNELELKAQGIALDKRGFDKLSDANRLLEELHLESLQEYGEPMEDLDVVQVGDKFHVARGVEEVLDLPPLEMDDALVNEQAPMDELDEEIEDSVMPAEAPSEDKKAAAEKRLRELFLEIAKESKAKEILSEDLEPRETLPGRERPDIEPVEEADQNYWEELLAAEGMKDELPLESDQAGVSEEFELRDDDYSKDLVDYINETNGGGTVLGSGLGGLQKFFPKGAPRDPFKGVAAKFDVEYPFKKVGWPELGLAIKNRHSVKMLYEEEGLRTVQQLSDLELSPAEHGIAIILHENPKMQTPKLMKKYGKAVKIYDEFFDTWLKRYQEKGGLENGFVENFVERQEKKLKNINSALRRAKASRDVKPERVEKLQRKREQIKQVIREVRNSKYTPALSLWFEEMQKKNPGQLAKVFKIFAHRVREIPTLKGLYDAKLVTLDQLDGRKIVAHYTRRAAHDMAMLDIKNAGLKEGALAKKPIKGKHMVPVDGHIFPMLKKLWIDPRLNEYLMTMASHWRKGGKLRQVVMAIKGAQFINPLFLGGYDIIQGTMTGSLLSLHTPKNTLRALKEVYNFGEHYKRAFLDGAYSQPVNNPLQVWDDKVIRAMHPAQVRLIKALTSGGLSWPIKNIYNAAHAGAWAFDRVVRTVTYLNLLDRGFSPLDAAQLTAKIHGDYASVPMELRQAAGLVLFTPTFKITMGKLYYDMAKSTLKFALKPHEIIMSKDPKTGKWRRTKLTRQHAMAFGAAMFFGLSYARDKLMRMAGYQRERYGWRYFREIDSDEGPKEIAHSFGDPLAMPWKYLWRVYDAFRPGPKTAIDNLINSFRYEVHPFLQPIIFDLKDNMTPDGKPIYSMVDPKPVKLLKMGQYLTRRYVRIVDAVIPTEATKERRKLMDREFGRIMSVLMSTSVFSYVRRTRGERAVSKLQAARRRLLWEIKKTQQPLSDKQLKNYENMIRSILKEGGLDELD